MSRFAADERAALVAAMAAAGPDAPTLCAGWTVRDLAAHLVVRERRPDAAAGIVISPLSGWGERVRRDYARKDFDHLLDLERSGPPRASVFALPGAEESLNLSEHFVHCEDVLRAQPGWTTPRALPEQMQAALWAMISARARLFLRRAEVGVTLRIPDGSAVQARAGTPRVTVTGLPSELVLYLFGRTGHAVVTVEGPPDAVRTFRTTRLGV